MSKIDEYNISTQAEGPVSGTTPIIDEVTKAGRGVSDFGAQLENAGDLVQRRQDMAESSEANAALSDQHLNYFNRIQQQTADGTIDTKNITDDFDQDSQKISQGLSTRHAQAIFEKQNERLRTQVLISAGRAQAQVAGRNAVMSDQLTQNNDQQIARQDPDQFDFLRENAEQRTQNLIQTGAIQSPAQQATYRTKALKDLARATAEGVADKDYNDAVSQAQAVINDPKQGPNAVPKAEALEKSITSFNTVSQVIDGRKLVDKDGNELLDASDKKSLLAYQQKQQNAAVTEINRLVSLRKAQDQETAQNWQNQHFAALKSGTLQAHDIMNAPMTWQDKDTFLKMADRAAADQTNNSTVENRVRASILNGDITDHGAIYKQVGTNKLSTDAAERLAGYLDKTPVGQAVNFNRKQILDYAKAALVKGGGIAGMPDPQGEEHFNQFAQALQDKEAQFTKEGKPISSLYKVGGPDYFASQENMQLYKRTPQQIISAQAAMMQGRPVPTQVTPAAGATSNLSPQYNQGNYNSPLPPTGEKATSDQEFADMYYRGDIKKAQGVLAGRKAKAASGR